MPINYSKWDDIGSSDDEANDAADRREVEAMLRGAVDMDPMERKFYEARLGEERVRPPPPPGAVSRVQASGADAAIASARATPMRREAFQLMDEARRAHMIGDIDTAVSKAGAAYVHDEKGCIILGGEDFARDIKQAAERISARGASADRELYVRAEVLLANLAILAGDTASSVHHQRRAVEARPESFRLRTHLAAFYACDQRVALARQALEEALARVDAGGAIDDPSPDAEASARFNLARCDHGLRRHGRGRRGLSRVRRAGPRGLAGRRPRARGHGPRALHAGRLAGRVQSRQGRGLDDERALCPCDADRGSHVARGARRRRLGPHVTSDACADTGRPAHAFCRGGSGRGARRALL